jgi:hypothetical protein
LRHDNPIENLQDPILQNLKSLGSVKVQALRSGQPSEMVPSFALATSIDFAG